MRAWLLHDASGPAGYRLDEVPTPEPAAGEVRVRLQPRLSTTWTSGSRGACRHRPSFPHVTGADGAGVVDAVGPQVDDVAIGDEVVIDPSTSCGACPACLHGQVPFCRDFRIVGEHRWGTHAEAVVVPAVNVRSKPSSLSWEQAAARGLVDVVGAPHAATRARFEPGDDVLVVGVGGGTSVAAVLLATALGRRARVRDLARARASSTGRRHTGRPEASRTDGPFDEQVREATDGPRRRHRRSTTWAPRRSNARSGRSHAEAGSSRTDRRAVARPSCTCPRCSGASSR